eukprot:TRINITY_DN11391_c0_g1_i16.p1 TRINITY_DN11391_c0_g1~~TRINITY_DN11391_c0_g1_i16.p1  ORF type:complete len:224 (-),score=11.60 TRINITY_DN11391_c0_g1_i16:23-694(-)
MKSWKRMKPHKKFSLLIYYQTQIPPYQMKVQRISKKKRKKPSTKSIRLNRMIQVPRLPALPINNKTKVVKHKKSILVAVHTVMQKPTPPVLDFIPTSFVSKVDHLRHLFAFLSYQKFCEIVLKYLSDFLFEKHRSDIEHALTIFTTVDERVLLIDTLWEECKGYALSQPPIEPDKDENSSFPNSWYDIDDLNSPRPVLCVDTTASYLPWREVDKGQQGVYGGH